MAQSDQAAPQYPGMVTAKNFTATFVPFNGTIIRHAKQSVIVHTNGLAEVDVFGTTNGIRGTFVGATALSKDATSANIVLLNGLNGTAFIIAKGSQGEIRGSAFAHAPFLVDGTATIRSTSATGQARVELEFIQDNPQLFGNN